MYPSGQGMDSLTESSSFVSVGAIFMLFFSSLHFGPLPICPLFLPYFSLDQRTDYVVCLNCMLVLWCYKFLFWFRALSLNYVIIIIKSYFLDNNWSVQLKKIMHLGWNLGSEPHWRVCGFASKLVVFVSSSVFSFLSSRFLVSQPCHDDPDKEQRIKELELLLMSAENEVRRQSGPRVRSTVWCVRVE